MTFASAPYARERLAGLVGESHPEVVILECSAIPDFEYTALQALTKAEERLREHGITLWLTALNPEALNVVSCAHRWARLWDGTHVLQSSRCGNSLWEKRECGTVTPSGSRGNLAFPLMRGLKYFDKRLPNRAGGIGDA